MDFFWQIFLVKQIRNSNSVLNWQNMAYDDDDVANETNKFDEKDLKIEASKVMCQKHFWVWKKKLNVCSI